jgi:hypothetical protein
MKMSFLKATAIAGSMFVMLACGEKKAAEGRAEELHEEHADHEVMQEETHEKLNTAEDVRSFPEPAPTLQQQVGSLLNDYLAIKDALVESSAEGTSEAASQLLASIKGFSAGKDLPQDQQEYYNEQAEGMQDQLRNMVQATAVNKQRDHFAVVTKNIYQLSKAFNPGKEPVYYQYCPMAFNNNGGYWLSAQEEIRNPYFGDKMLKCGRVEETL